LRSKRRRLRRLQSAHEDLSARPRPGAVRSRPRGAASAPPGFEITPPRLSFIDGSVSFWRPGAEDWAPAQDACGAWMRREHFGHEASEFGWKIERVAPGARRTAP
jgi:hypothetical protein